MIERLFKRIRDAQRLLERNHAYMAAAVLQLGTVRFTEEVPTAAIVTRGRAINLYVSPTFLSHLDDAELAGVLAHEALHFLLEHQARALELTNGRDRFLFKFCCEAVVNDLIIACLQGLKLPGQPVRGQSLVGHDVSQMPAEELLQELRRRSDSKEQDLEEKLVGLQTMDDHGPWEMPLAATRPWAGLLPFDDR